MANKIETSSKTIKPRINFNHNLHISMLKSMLACPTPLALTAYIHDLNFQYLIKENIVLEKSAHHLLETGPLEHS